jgi:hypothetical protein
VRITSIDWNTYLLSLIIIPAWSCAYKFQSGSNNIWKYIHSLDFATRYLSTIWENEHIFCTFYGKRTARVIGIINSISLFRAQ